mmetsp:Transcript_98228/g.305459  ORF Transcript_98228/g.305459 Transcript_98228/m.305459 type:complete len:541 (+) Transcript_98228:90-1712(+)
MAGRRTSITLNDVTLLRATTPAVILERVGRRLRQSVGGIGGIASDDEEDDFACSFPVGSIDIFLSHSWHARWQVKYLTLLFYFNAVPSVLATSVLGGLCACWLWWDSEVVPKDQWEFGKVYPICQAVGSVAYMIVLICWHHVLVAAGRSPTMFVDKVCIDQTHPERKLKGIKSIGAVLANSQTMLVTWDKSYFERLWCTYEMSAFRHSNPDGKIEVLPVALGEFVAAYGCTTFLADAALTCLEPHLFTDERTGGVLVFQASALIHFPLYCLCSRIFVRYINNLNALKYQLAKFSVSDAKCFCCENAHKHPDTGATLPCDREVVNASIEYWMGLDTFDKMVRGEFKLFVKKTLGGWAKLPYRFAVAASVYPGLAALDHMSASTQPYAVRALFALESTFLRHPVIIALVVALLRRHARRTQARLGARLRRCGCQALAKAVTYMLSGLAFTALYCLTLDVSLSLSVRPNPAWWALWLALELAAVVTFYFNRNFSEGDNYTQQELWNMDETESVELADRWSTPWPPRPPPQPEASASAEDARTT